MAFTAAQAPVIVGRDVSVYSLGAYGLDGNPNAGVAVNLLGRWRKISVEVTPEWFDVSPSDADLKERRRGPIDWRASCENLLRAAANYSGGGTSTAMSLLVNQDYAHVVFTEEESGFTFHLYGGIDRARYERDREAGNDTLDVICVGPIGPGGVSFSYS